MARATRGRGGPLATLIVSGSLAACGAPKVRAPEGSLSVEAPRLLAEAGQITRARAESTIPLTALPLPPPGVGPERYVERPLRLQAGEISRGPEADGDPWLAWALEAPSVQTDRSVITEQLQCAAKGAAYVLATTERGPSAITRQDIAARCGVVAPDFGLRWLTGALPPGVPLWRLHTEWADELRGLVAKLPAESAGGLALAEVEGAVVVALAFAPRPAQVTAVSLAGGAARIEVAGATVSGVIAGSSGITPCAAEATATGTALRCPGGAPAVITLEAEGAVVGRLRLGPEVKGPQAGLSPLAQVNAARGARGLRSLVADPALAAEAEAALAAGAAARLVTPRGDEAPLRRRVIYTPCSGPRCVARALADPARQSALLDPGARRWGRAEGEGGALAVVETPAEAEPPSVAASMAEAALPEGWRRWPSLESALASALAAAWDTASPDALGRLAGAEGARYTGEAMATWVWVGHDLADFTPPPEAKGPRRGALIAGQQRPAGAPWSRHVIVMAWPR